MSTESKEQDLRSQWYEALGTFSGQPEDKASIGKILEEGACAAESSDDPEEDNGHWKLWKMVWENADKADIKKALENKKLEPWAIANLLVLTSLKNDLELLRELAGVTMRQPQECWDLTCMLAVNVKDPKALELILEVMPAENLAKNRKSLRSALMRGSLEKAQMLLEHGANPNGLDFDAVIKKELPILAFVLQQAKREESLAAASLLLQYGALPEIPEACAHRIAQSVSVTLTLGLAEWMRENKILAKSETHGTKEAMTPAALGHALWGHLRDNRGEAGIKEARSTIKKWPTSTLQIALENRQESLAEEIFSAAPGSQESPTRAARNLLWEEIQERKRLAISKTRSQKQGPELEF